MEKLFKNIDDIQNNLIIKKEDISDIEIIGIKGDKGDGGKDGKNGIDGRNGKDGLDGKDGKDGKNGIDGKDGKNGSPDTPDEVTNKINLGKPLIKKERIEGLVDIENNLKHNIYTGISETRALELIRNNSSTGTGVSLGTDNQIPFVNASGTDFDYSANLTFDGSLETLTADGLGTSQVSTKGIRLINNTAATALAPTQITPPIIFKSYAWRTDTSVSQYGEIRMYSKPITGAGAIAPRLIIEGSRNGAAFSDMLRLWDSGRIEIIGAIDLGGSVGSDGNILISKAGAANQWASTLPWSYVSSSAPTTLSGYGITDALVSSQGAYTPTLTNIANVASSTMRPTQWVKVGKTVHLYGTFEITPSSATTKTEFTIDIPVASTNGFANIYEAGGTANALHPDDENAGVPMPVTIWADNGTWTDTQSIYMKYSAVSTTNAVFSFHLSYTIDPSAE